MDALLPTSSRGPSRPCVCCLALGVCLRLATPFIGWGLCISAVPSLRSVWLCTHKGRWLLGGLLQLTRVDTLASSQPP